MSRVICVTQGSQASKIVIDPPHAFTEIRRDKLSDFTSDLDSTYIHLPPLGKIKAITFHTHDALHPTASTQDTAQEEPAINSCAADVSLVHFFLEEVANKIQQ